MPGVPGIRYRGLSASKLTTADLDAIMAAAGETIAYDLLRHQVVAMECVYWSKKLNAEPRDETRYQLRLIAHLCWKMDADPSTKRAIWTEIKEVLRFCNRDVFEGIRAAQIALFGIDNKNESVSFDIPRIHYRLLGHAADSVQQNLTKRGDYRNSAVADVIGLLFFSFDTCTGSFPTFSRRGVGADGKGSQRTIANSRFGRFLLTFFERVDPDVPATLVTNHLETVRAKAVEEERAGRRYYQDVVNLL